MSEEEKTLIFAKHYIKDNEGVFEFPKKELEILVNLIEKQNNRLEQLEKENKELKHNNKIIAEAYEYEYTEREQNYIPKSVIREKIEELEKAKGKYDDTPRLYTAYDTYDFQINILKELLGEEK